MSDTMIDCEEIAGKTVRRLRLATGESGSQEVHIDFTDGTAFSLMVQAKTTREARLVSVTDIGTETLCTYGE